MIELKNIDAIIQSIGEGLVVVDLEGKIIFVNKKFEELLGWKSEEVIGKNFLNLVKKVDSKGNEVNSENRMVHVETDTPRVHQDSEHEYYYMRKDGSKFPVNIVSAPVIENGVQTGIVQTFQDITSQIELDKAKTDFVALASHQMRTPLTIIRWYLEMVVDEDKGNLSIDQRTYIKKVLDAHERINSLINTFLTISKVQMDKMEQHFEFLDMEALIEDIQKGFIDQIKAKSIKLDVSLPLSLERIYADTKTVETVIHNLLDNSIKYSSNGSKIELKIFKTTPKDNNKYLSIQVKDEGMGIPKNQQHLVFSELFRGDNIKKISTDGNGLGLYIVKLLVEKIGGSIYFESEENKGTLFHINIPIKEIEYNNN